MTTIYITRHGQTVWNVEKRLQGQGNSDLTEKGIRGAELLAKRFKDIDIDLIVSSPLKRTIQTSEIIRSDKNIPIYTDSAFKEINVGSFSGRTLSELEIDEPELVNKIKVDPYKTSYPGGENLVEFYDRCVEGFKNAIKNYKDKSILIVAHGGVLKCIECFAKGIMIPIDWTEDVAENCSLTKYTSDDGVNIKIEFLNSTEHLMQENNI